MATKPEIFIVESLNFDDEAADRREGEILSRMLKLIGKENTTYYYIRTKRELKEIIKKFDESNFRYLHFSCHADKNGMATTLDHVSYEELGKMLEPCMLGRRVFVSGCEMATPKLAGVLLKNTGCISLLGPAKKINFADAAAFWLAFYHLMFKKNKKSMKHRHVKLSTTELSMLLRKRFNYYLSDKSKEAGCRKINTWKELL
ncbi:MAG: hypothetical protein CGW95_11455 [Phenylobacterium zucineum]|nr:MAG: hypothetical protein CGW95_11455 [Phenylobacterium zucineum]